MKTLKLLITGSRVQNNYSLLEKGIEKVKEITGLQPTTILHGGAKGIDQLAKNYAKLKQIHETELRPDYMKYHYKKAPLKRNEDLVNNSDVVLAIYSNRGKTGGTAYTANFAIKSNILVIEIYDNGNIQVTPVRQVLSLF